MTYTGEDQAPKKSLQGFEQLLASFHDYEPLSSQDIVANWRRCEMRFAMIDAPAAS
jgi:hypothetical protein